MANHKYDLHILMIGQWLHLMHIIMCFLSLKIEDLITQQEKSVSMSHCCQRSIVNTIFLLSVSISFFIHFDYILCFRLGTLPVACSILVSFISAILVLGTPAEMYTRGTQLFMRTIGYCLALFLSSLIFVPLFFPLKITSSFEVSSSIP